MAKLEERSRKRARKKNLQKIILESVAAAGVLSIALVAPNVIKALGKTGIIPNRRQKEYIGSSASKLVKRGLLVFDDGRYKLTSKGENVLKRFEFADFKLKHPSRWDSKWRVIIFDIPEKKKKARNQIRYLLMRAGLKRLQDSVWVYPYDCEDILTLLKTELGVGKDTLYLIVEELENDRYLREEFSLI